MGLIHRRRWGPLLQLALDGEASAARAARVARHVGDCPDCAAELELVRLMKSALARLRRVDGSEPALDRLRSHAGQFTS